MKSPKPNFDGDTLVLPDWKFSAPSPRVPHRSYTMAANRSGRVQYFVSHNQPRTLFWVRAIGPGFAGDHSRYSATCVTRSAQLANAWADAVNAGRVRVENKS